jgi:N-acetylglutamate synthase-like GNAT family acetyltransferase
MENTSVKIHRVHSGMEAEIAELLRIYQEAHPASERKSVKALLSMLQRSDYFFHVASQEGRIVGFSIVLCFLEADAALLEYMAIDRKWRGRGIGQILFHGVVQLQEMAERFLLAEVDSDRAGTADQIAATRRKAFYRRLGCRQIENLRYLMPQVSTALPPAMELLVHQQNLPSVLERSHLRVWLESCYAQVYGKDAHDPRIEAMLKPLPAALRLL